MRANRVMMKPMNPMSCASIVLGQASLWMGVVVGVVWAGLFGMLAQHAWVFHGSGRALTLPVEPPLIGLGLGTLAVMFAALGHRRATAATVAGVVFNALALALAVAILKGCLG